MRGEEPIAFLGAGNVAWHLAPALENHGYSVREVYSRSRGHAKKLVKRLYQADALEWSALASSSCRYLFMTVSDDALPELAERLSLPPGMQVLHCSGSVSLDIIAPITGAAGVFYPLQTFSRERQPEWTQVPVFYEATHSDLEKTLHRMGKALTGNVVQASSEVRRKVHLAAVVAANFSNHMCAVADELLKQDGLSFDLLKPLLIETIQKALDLAPAQVQTGPARRGDLEILDQHMDMLKDQPELQELYQKISQHILDQYH